MNLLEIHNRINRHDKEEYVKAIRALRGMVVSMNAVLYVMIKKYGSQLITAKELEIVREPVRQTESEICQGVMLYWIGEDKDAIQERGTAEMGAHEVGDEGAGREEEGGGVGQGIEGQVKAGTDAQEDADGKEA